MKVTLGLLIVATIQISAGKQIGSCVEEIDHVPDNGDKKLSSTLELDTDYYLKAVTDDEDFTTAGFVCSKLQVSVKDENTDRVKLAAQFRDFTLTIIKDLTTVNAGDIVKDKTGHLIKSVNTSYGKIAANYFPFEHDLRYPGVTYLRAIHLDKDLVSLWECDELAPKDDHNKDDVRYVYTKDMKFNYDHNHASYLKTQSGNNDPTDFEGHLDIIGQSKVNLCKPLTYDDNLV